MKTATQPTCIHGHDPKDCTSADHPTPQETPARRIWTCNNCGYEGTEEKQEHHFCLPETEARFALSDNHFGKASVGQIAVITRLVERALRVSVNRDPAFQKLLKVAETLDRLDWIIGYELTDANMRILDEALDAAREALRLAREGEG